MTPENPGRHDEDTNKEEKEGTKEKVVKCSPTDTPGTLEEKVKDNDPDTSEKSGLVDRPLVDRLADTLAEVEAETLGDRLGELEAEPLVDRLADTLAEVEAETLGDRLGELEAEPLVDRLADTLAEVEAEALGDRLGELEQLVVVFDVVKPSTGCHVGLFVVPFVMIYR